MVETAVLNIYTLTFTYNMAFISHRSSVVKKLKRLNGHLKQVNFIKSTPGMTADIKHDMAPQCHTTPWQNDYTKFKQLGLLKSNIKIRTDSRRRNESRSKVELNRVN